MNVKNLPQVRKNLCWDKSGKKLNKGTLDKKKYFALDM